MGIPGIYQRKSNKHPGTYLKLSRHVHRYIRTHHMQWSHWCHHRNKQNSCIQQIHSRMLFVTITMYTYASVYMHRGINYKITVIHNNTSIRPCHTVQGQYIISIQICKIEEVHIHKHSHTSWWQRLCLCNLVTLSYNYKQNTARCVHVQWRSCGEYLTLYICFQRIVFIIERQGALGSGLQY